MTSIAAFFSLAGCNAPPSPRPPLQPRPVVEVERWGVFDGGTRLGDLVLLEIRDPKGLVRFYQVEDGLGRIVGSATVSGRFGRRVPFQDEEQDLGVWRLERGVAMLFDLDGPVELRVRPDGAGRPGR